MKSQIFAGIALLIAGVVTVEVNEIKEPEVTIKEAKVITTEDLIRQSSLNEITDKIEQNQDSVGELIKETIEDRIVDSAIVPMTVEDSISKK